MTHGLANAQEIPTWAQRDRFMLGFQSFRSFLASAPFAYPFRIRLSVWYPMPRQTSFRNAIGTTNSIYEVSRNYTDINGAPNEHDLSKQKELNRKFFVFELQHPGFDRKIGFMSITL